MSAFDNDYGDDEAWDRAQAKAAMSEAKSPVVWKTWEDLCLDLFSLESFLELDQEHDYEYAHDLSGRFLGVFREVKS